VRLPVLAILCALLVGGGCSPYAQRGQTLFQEGRYIEAAEVFELTEARLERCSDDTKAEYGLYRGLTFLRLDDLESARQWLGYAYGNTQRNPKVLGVDDQALLQRGWAELEQRSQATPSRHPAPENRVATTENGAAPRSTQPVPNGRRNVATP
jgi:hypothetical protein